MRCENADAKKPSMRALMEILFFIKMILRMFMCLGMGRPAFRAGFYYKNLVAEITTPIIEQLPFISKIFLGQFGFIAFKYF